VTSPPYWGLRSYLPEGHPDKGLEQGLEESPDAYVERMVGVFREVHRVLRKNGTCWLNIGDSYASAWACNRRNMIGNGSLDDGKRDSRPNRLVGDLKEKDLVGIPWMLAFALRKDGWCLRQDIIWSKRNCMPESVSDRCTKAHELIFLLAKSVKYFYDAEAIKEAASDESHGALEGGCGVKAQTTGNHSGPLGLVPSNGKRNARSVWDIPTSPFSGAHFATMPVQLATRCIKAGTSEKGCCSVCGSPWTRILDKEPGRCDRPNHPYDPNRPDGMSLRGGRLSPGKVLSTEWVPTCKCTSDSIPIPCTVLDPFFGAGTTGLAAMQLGRSAIGIELNQDYAEIACKRLTDNFGVIGDDSLVEVAH